MHSLVVSSLSEESRSVAGERSSPPETGGADASDCFFLASGGVVAHTAPPSIDHPVCAKQGTGPFLYGAATPPVSGGELRSPRRFSITRTHSCARISSKLPAPRK